MGRLIKKDDIEKPTLLLSMADEKLLNFIEASHQKKLFINSAKKGLVEAATIFAKKISHENISLDKKFISEEIKRSMKMVTNLEPGTVTVHPDADIDSELENIIIQSGFVLERNSSFEKNDCILKAEDIVIDSRLDTAIYLFKKNIEEHV